MLSHYAHTIRGQRKRSRTRDVDLNACRNREAHYIPPDRRWSIFSACIVITCESSDVVRNHIFPSKNNTVPQYCIIFCPRRCIITNKIPLCVVYIIFCIVNLYIIRVNVNLVSC